LRNQCRTDFVPRGLRDDGDVSEVKCVLMRLKQEETNDDFVDLSDPHLTRAKSICVNGWCPREGRIPGASRFVDRLKAFDFLRLANPNEHGRF
jgi:hypothetical protein